MILVVDDETEIADLVEVYLKNEGYLVKKASCAAEALHIADTQPIALALLDVMLPDLDGFTLCRKIREKHLFPLIMLTAKTEDVDKITGLTLGADDYITKPVASNRWRSLHASRHSCDDISGTTRLHRNLLRRQCTTAADCTSTMKAIHAPSTANRFR